MYGLDVLLWASYALVALAFLHAAAWLVRGNERHLARGRRLLWAGAGGLTLLVLSLAYAFVAARMDLLYVWQFAQTGDAWWQRLSGLWIGREGSLLLWVWLATLWVSGEQLLQHVAERRRGTPGDPHGEPAAAPARAGILDRAARGRSVTAWTLVLGTGLLALFLTLLGSFVVQGATSGQAACFPTANDPARWLVPTPPECLQAAASGRGVNPQLLTIFNFIHPPILFTGYSLCVIPTIAAASHLATGGRGWTRVAAGWTQAAFLFLTAGVGLGGVWAYTVLGWGGYWAWDPVETASLIPWILVTGFLHALQRASLAPPGRGARPVGDLPLAAPAMGYLTLAGVLFSTLVVRAGGVWQSVHSFLGTGMDPSAWGRFMDALSTNPEVQGYTFLLAAMLLAFVPLILAHLRRVEAGEAANPPGGRGPIQGAFVAFGLPPARDALLRAATGGEPTADAAGPAAATPGEARPSRPAGAAPESPPAGPPGAGSGATAPFAPRRSTSRAAWERTLALLTLPNLFLVAVMLFAIAATVIITILVVGANGFASDDARFDVFQTRTAPIALTLAVAMSVGLSIGSLPRSRLPTLLGWMAALAVAGALVFPEHWALGAAIPVLATAAVISLFRIRQAFRVRKRRDALRTASIHTIHLGVMVLLLGHGLVSTFQAEHPGVELGLGESRTMGDATYRLDALEPIDENGDGRAERVAFTLSITEDGKDLGSVDAEYKYFTFNDFYRPGIGIRSWFTRDLYVIPRGLHDEDQGWIFSNLPLTLQGKRVADVEKVDRINVEVMELPYLRLVWTGWGLMLLGAALRVVTGFRRPGG